MILDAYYRLRFYAVGLCRQKQTALSTYSVATPETAMCDGTKVTALYSGYDYRYYPGDYAPFFVPYKGMRSQLTTVSYADYPYSNIIVGTGTTPPTAADYRMESELVSELDCLSVTCEYTHGGILTYHKTMLNASAETLAVTEVGLSEVWCVAGGSAAISGRQVLVMREVLEEPIVVAPGETFTVTVRHQFQTAA